MLTFIFEFYTIFVRVEIIWATNQIVDELFFLLRINWYRFYQVYNYYAILRSKLELLVERWKVVCRESSSRIFAPSQYLMASNTESDIRLLEPQILESWKSVFRGWPVFRYSTALRHHIPMFANKSLVDHSINLLDSQKPCIRSTKKELDFFPVFVVKNGEIKNTL